MNLLFDDWISVERQSGRVERIAPVRMTANADDPVMEIVAPRADFRGALYQFLIGALQTMFAPQDMRQWRARWEKEPTEAELSAAFEAHRTSFEIDGDGVRFLQDFNLSEAKSTGISALLIDAPGEKTVAENKDHFVHRDGVRGICIPCAAAALLTLQVNAPSGGGGGGGQHVSVRGGGPLTTLLIPENEQASLWQKVWINVLPEDDLGYARVTKWSDVFPWTAETRYSNQGKTTPELVHPLQAYWSMSRRIRIDFAGVGNGECDLCGEDAMQLITHYLRATRGVDYGGAWLHPLTPYRYDPKSESEPTSIKGQPDGIGYSHWLGLVIGNQNKVPDAARVVRHYQSRWNRLPADAQRMRLWCFGYDLEKMKARCWYDAKLPVYSMEEEAQQYLLKEAAQLLLNVAEEASAALWDQVKAAWFEHPAQKKEEETAVAQSFWRGSEEAFYRVLEKIAHSALKDHDELAPFYRNWLNVVERIAIEQFDYWVLTAPVGDMRMKRVVLARTELCCKLRTAKSIKALQKFVNGVQEAEE